MYFPLTFVKHLLTDYFTDLIYTEVQEQLLIVPG